MKIKRVTLGFSILGLATVFVLSCKKETPVAPVADTEVQSAIYASWANYVASDIEMACSFMAENNYDYPDMFYNEYPGSPVGNTGYENVIRDTNCNHASAANPTLCFDQMVMTWNSAKCQDGNLRDGSLVMYVQQESQTGDKNKNVRYSRDYEFQGQIWLPVSPNPPYRVNGWAIELYDSTAPLYLYNKLSSSTYDPSSTKITWKFAGKFKLTHPTDHSRNMVWDGELFKTLENTSNTKVFLPTKHGAITWSLATVSYYGHMNGTGPQIDENDKVTASNVPYKMEINQATPLVRDFTCASDVVTGVAFGASPTSTATIINPRGSQHHPFIKGVASFTVGNSYPRQIYYGNEGEPQLAPQCDNVGEVLIKGTTYKINFLE